MHVLEISATGPVFSDRTKSAQPRLTAWLDMPLDRVMAARQHNNDGDEAVVYFPHESTPEIVEAHLRADRNLSPETASALSELLRVAYTQFSRTGEKPSRQRR